MRLFIVLVALVGGLAGCTMTNCSTAPGANLRCVGLLWGGACQEVAESCNLNAPSSNP